MLVVIVYKYQRDRARFTVCHIFSFILGD